MLMDIGDEANQVRLSVIAFTAAAAAAGLVSFWLEPAYTSWLSIFIGFGVLAAVCVGVMRLTKKGVKWLMGNGAVAYLFVWAVTWIMLYNLYG